MTAGLAVVTLAGSSEAAGPETEYVVVRKVMASQVIIVRADGTAHLVDKDLGCLSLFEGRRVVLQSPGRVLGVGSKLILPDAGQECRIWNAKPVDAPASPAAGAQQPSPPPPPNQVALTEAREHAKAGRTQEALAALERVTPPAPGVINQLRTSDDFKALRDSVRFQAIVTRLTPCAGPEYKEFDFWVGEWDVRNAAGQVLGRNRISKKYGGCVVVEEWESASGGSGSSFNFYDQPTKQWHQFWVDATGTNWLSSDKQGNPVTLRGGIRDGAMVLTSHPDTLPSIGLTRATWRPLPDGGVRQTFESSSDGGKTWTTSFDGIYKKKSS